jgi:DNA-binding CsgD family transcriptional regulator
MAFRVAGCAERVDGHVASAVSAAFHVCALRSYDDVKALIPHAKRTTAPGLLLAATVFQLEGDAPRAELALRRAFAAAGEEERPYVVDVLAPLLISRGLFTRAAAMLGSTSSPQLEIARVALHAVTAAASGNRETAKTHIAAARRQLRHTGDEVVRMRVRQRLALAAYYLGDTAGALGEVAAGLRSAQLLGAHSFACRLHAIAYAVHAIRTGDAEAAWRQTSALEREAKLGGDTWCGAFARVATYELTAERGDDGALAAVRRLLDAESQPHEYRERFASGVAAAMRLAWNGEFEACRSAVAVLRDAPGRTLGERAFCKALLALTAVALGDRDAARRWCRQAISTSGRPEKRLAAAELRYRRLARALAIVGAALAGDVVRGRRAAEARFLQHDAAIRSLVGVRAESDLERVPARVRGYARFILAVQRRVALRPAPGPLTGMEMEILRLVAAGRNAPQIAAALGRSPHTIRTHLRNASAKLDAHGRTQMIARARELGVVTDSS